MKKLLNFFTQPKPIPLKELLGMKFENDLIQLDFPNVGSYNRPIKKAENKPRHGGVSYQDGQNSALKSARRVLR